MNKDILQREEHYFRLQKNDLAKIESGVKDENLEDKFYDFLDTVCVRVNTILYNREELFGSHELHPVKELLKNSYTSIIKNILKSRATEGVIKVVMMTRGNKDLSMIIRDNGEWNTAIKSVENDLYPGGPWLGYGKILLTDENGHPIGIDKKRAWDSFIGFHAKKLEASFWKNWAIVKINFSKNSM